MMNTLILAFCVFAAVMGVSVATWSILRTRTMTRRLQKEQRLEQIAEKLYLAVIDMLIRTSPNPVSPESLSSYEGLPEETKNLYRELVKRYFSDME